MFNIPHTRVDNLVCKIADGHQLQHRRNKQSERVVNRIVHEFEISFKPTLERKQLSEAEEGDFCCGYGLGLGW